MTDSCDHRIYQDRQLDRQEENDLCPRSFAMFPLPFANPRTDGRFITLSSLGSSIQLFIKGMLRFEACSSTESRQKSPGLKVLNNPILYRPGLANHSLCARPAAASVHTALELQMFFYVLGGMWKILQAG